MAVRKASLPLAAPIFVRRSRQLSISNYTNSSSKLLTQLPTCDIYISTLDLLQYSVLPTDTVSFWMSNGRSFGKCFFHISLYVYVYM